MNITKPMRKIISYTICVALAPSAFALSPIYGTGNQDAAHVPFDNSIVPSPSANVQSAIEYVAGLAGVSLSADNHFTGKNYLDYAPRTVQIDLAGGTVLTVDKGYTDSLSAIRTLTFTGTPSEGSTITLKLTVTNSPVLTIPSSKRIGEANSAITSLRMTNGVHLLKWQYLAGEWTLSDSVGTLNNSTTSDPTVNSDQTAGYSAFSQWLNTSSGIVFICRDASTGAAVWEQIVTPGNTATFTNKTFDASATGNILAQKSYLAFSAPGKVDGTGAVLQTADTTQVYFGQALFSNSAAATGNYAEYRTVVPEDVDTSVDLRARFKFRLSNTDTGKHRYVISMASVANSSSSGGSLSNAVNYDFAGDASGASGDIEDAGWVTLTGWKSSLTAGQLFVIRVARSGDDATNDTSTVDSYSGPLVIEYGATQ